MTAPFDDFEAQAVTPPAVEWVGPATRERPGPWPIPSGGTDVPNRTCTIDGCRRPVHARGWCDMHYLRWKRHGDPLVVRHRTDPVPRFWAKVDRSGDCWLWTAFTNRGGYGVGRLGSDGQHVPAHRFAYELLVGPIPEGLHIDHLCRVRHCVNPAHMEPVTLQENTRRGEGPSVINAAKTHCIHGHAFTPENTYTFDGKRQCRGCRRDRYRARKTAA